ncbi:hypothetical protein X798_02211, partial [Onchocerca flexuosa]
YTVLRCRKKSCGVCEKLLLEVIWRGDWRDALTMGEEFVALGRCKLNYFYPIMQLTPHIIRRCQESTPELPVLVSEYLLPEYFAFSQG